MLGLIATGVAGVAAVAGHIKSRRFVGKRLRYTKLVDRPALGLAAGIGAALVAAPIVALLPIVGAGTAIAVGAGVGTGVALGVRDAHEPPEYDD